MTNPYWKRVIEMEDDRARKICNQNTDGYENSLGSTSTAYETLHEHLKKKVFIQNLRQTIKDNK